MTPAQVLETVRNQAYEVSAKFWTDAEVYSYMWQGEQEIAAEIECALATNATTSTVSGTQEYAKPTDCLIIKRVAWDGLKLKKITLEQMDSIDGTTAGGTLSTGEPEYYYEFGVNIGLYPVPLTAKVIKFWYIKDPAQITGASAAFTVPAMFSKYIPDYCLWRMYAKDQDNGRAQFHAGLWGSHKINMLTLWERQKYRDSHNVVTVVESFQMTDWGLV